MAQFPTVNPGTPVRSESAVTTEQLPNEHAMAAIMMSICCMGRPMRLSSAARRPYSNAALSSNGQTFQADRAVRSLCMLRARGAQLDAVDELGQDRDADPDPVPPDRFVPGILVDVPATRGEASGRNSEDNDRGFC